MLSPFFHPGFNRTSQLSNASAIANTAHKIRAICAAVIACGLISLATTRARAGKVLILGDGSDTDTRAVQTLLDANGQTATIGPAISSFTGAGGAGGSLTGYQAVVLLDGDGTSGGYDMSSAGQTALLNFVKSGHGLVTGEWADPSKTSPNPMNILDAALPVMPDTSSDSITSLSYSRDATNSMLDAGVSSSFGFTADKDGGTEDDFTRRTGATVYYSSSGGDSPDGLVGWYYGSGMVLSFSTLCGPDELGNKNYGQLFCNSVKWVETCIVPEPVGLALVLPLVLALRRRGRRCAD